MSSLSSINNFCNNKNNNKIVYNDSNFSSKKKGEHAFCGTHIKGTPHGLIDIGLRQIPVKKIEVWVQEIKGIHYYIDENNNVYLPQDIISNTKSPRVIGTWILLENGDYSIPNLEKES